MQTYIHRHMKHRKAFTYSLSYDETIYMQTYIHRHITHRKAFTYSISYDGPINQKLTADRDANHVISPLVAVHQRRLCVDQLSPWYQCME